MGSSSSLEVQHRNLDILGEAVGGVGIPCAAVQVDPCEDLCRLGPLLIRLKSLCQLLPNVCNLAGRSEGEPQGPLGATPLPPAGVARGCTGRGLIEEGREA